MKITKKKLQQIIKEEAVQVHEAVAESRIIRRVQRKLKNRR